MFITGPVSGLQQPSEHEEELVEATTVPTGSASGRPAAACQGNHLLSGSTKALGNLYHDGHAYPIIGESNCN